MKTNKNFKILICDDMDQISDYIQSCLADIGIEKDCVDVTNNGIKAISLLQQNKYDLIITDLDLKGASGFDLIQSKPLSKININTPVVICSTKTGEAEVHRAVSLGIKHYILKPFTYNTLMSKIKHYLS